VKLPTLNDTEIHGLKIIEMDLRGDDRGWFTEAWNKSRLAGSELVNFQPLQQNLSFNMKKGTLRGLHAEPWDKFVTVAAGEVFCAWVDLRPGEGFGRVTSAILRPGLGAFIPSGVANGYQTLQDDTSYVYLVNAHWNPQIRYKAVHPFDVQLGIAWPIPRELSTLSEKDSTNPRLRDLTQDEPNSGYIFGANGQLGRELTRTFAGFRALEKTNFDVANREQVARLEIQPSDVLINAAAYTAVDAAETPAGIALAYEVNVRGVQNLAVASSKAGATLVHFSTDYVFDGSKSGSYHANDPLRPLNVYGLSKSAGEAIAITNPKTYLIRTSWIFGDGSNFVKSIFLAALEKREIRVVGDQFGRPTSTARLSQATKYLIDHNLPYGIYHVTDAGPLVSRYELAVFIYNYLRVPSNLVARTATIVSGVQTVASRPLNSDLGVQDGHLGEPESWQLTVTNYLERLVHQEMEQNV
jgi:dTDP-4-dehydrorhamnose 3,5-epimerase